MKGQHHKQTKNELADWLGEHIEQWRPYFPIIGIGIAVLLVGSIIYIVSSGEDTSTASAWQSYYAAYGEPKASDALKSVAEKQKDTLPGRWAKLAYADQELRQTTAKLGQDPKEAKAALSRVEKTLREVESGATEPALRTRVYMSLAKVCESENKLQEAREYYAKVADPKNNEETFAKAAAKALRRLETGSDVPELLAWLDKQQPAKTPKTPGSMFELDQPQSLPERPDLSIPGQTKSGGTSPLDFGPLKGPTLPGTEGPLFPKGPLTKPEAPKVELPKSGETKTPPAVPGKPAVPMSTKPAVPTPVKPADKPAEKAAEPKKKPAEENKAAEEKKM